MSAVVEHRTALPAPPQQVLAELLDPEFLRAWAVELGARLEAVEVQPEGTGSRTTVRLAVPTRGIPPVFARFVGGEVTVVDSTLWQDGGTAGATGALEVRARILGRTALVLGRRALEPDGEGTRSTTDAEVTVKAPLVGRQVEAAVAELVGVVLRQECELLTRRLSA